MSSGTLAMRVRREPGRIAVITVTGEVDIATVAVLRDRLFRLADTSRSVIVDLDQVSFTDAATAVKDETASSAHDVRDQARTARDTVTDSRH